MKINKISEITEDYFNQPAISYSFLKSFSQSPAHAFISYETQAMSFGTALHDIILEKKEYYVYEKLDGRSKEGKEQKSVIEQKQANGELILPKEDYDIIKTLESELMTRDIAGESFDKILENSAIEQGLLAECELDGEEFNIRIKPDIIYRDKIIDLKTIGNCNEFKWNAKKFKYHWQDYLYSKIVSELSGQEMSFYFAVCEKNQPNGVKIFCLEYEIEKEIEIIIRKYLEWRRWGEDKTEKYKNQVEYIYIY